MRADLAADFHATTARFAKESTKFDKVELPADQRRQLNLLRLSLVMVTPSVPQEAEELTTIAARVARDFPTNKRG